MGGDVIMDVGVGKGKGDGVKVGKRLNVGRGGAVDSNWAVGADAGVWGTGAQFDHRGDFFTQLGKVRGKNARSNTIISHEGLPSDQKNQF